MTTHWREDSHGILHAVTCPHCHVIYLKNPITESYHNSRKHRKEWKEGRRVEWWVVR